MCVYVQINLLEVWIIRLADVDLLTELVYKPLDLKHRLYLTHVVISSYYGYILMQTNDLLRHQIIRRLIPQETEKVADAAINLWEQMAAKIISIVGESGFNSLYERNVFLTQSTFPWLGAASLLPQTDHRFTKLRLSLEGQTPAQARAANSLLLITFTDILALLIGEELTSSILRSAWGNNASDKAGMELNND
jgi:hypothetical protein